MDDFWVSFGIFMLGLVLLCSGFSRRRYSGGILMMTTGVVCMLAIIFYRVITALSQ